MTYEWLREPKVHRIGHNKYGGYAIIVVAELGVRNERGDLRACGKIYRRDFVLPWGFSPFDELRGIAKAFEEIARAYAAGETALEGDDFGEPAKYRFVPPLKGEGSDLCPKKSAGTSKRSVLSGARSVLRAVGTALMARR